MSSVQSSVSPLAFGRRSVIYRYAPGQVLKLYQKGFPSKEIQEEFVKTLAIATETTLPVPRPIKILEQNGQLGIVFEYVSGTSAMDLMMQKVWLVPKIVETLVSIHKRIHHETVSLISQEECFLPMIEQSDRLTKNEFDKVKRAFANLRTDCPKLCHGDFHQGNVLFAEDGTYTVLDWMDAFSGNPLLDLALTAVNAVTSTTPPHIPKIFSLLYEGMARMIHLDRWVVREYGVSEKDPQMRDALFIAAAIHIVRCKEKSWEKQKKYLSSML
jgi:aminoglycoside phosphotransferase (APT) family kinase protein